MDPSMLLGFLIKDEADWENWKRALDQVPGKHIIRISDKAPPLHGHGPEREGAVDEVETLDDDEDGEYVVTPSA
jgi:cysteine protease ATG4